MGVTQLLLGEERGAISRRWRRHVLTVISQNSVTMSEERPTFLLSARFLFWRPAPAPLPVHAQPRQRARPRAAPSKSPNRHHSTRRPFWLGINVVSQSANLGRLTRARILRPPKRGKRKRQERTRRARPRRPRWARKTKMAGVLSF